jgi:hypothetical protein
MADPIQFDPVRTEERGEFPVHSDRPRHRLTATQAKAKAYWRLQLWKERHGIRD